MCWNLHTFLDSTNWFYVIVKITCKSKGKCVQVNINHRINQTLTQGRHICSYYVSYTHKLGMTPTGWLVYSFLCCIDPTAIGDHWKLVYKWCENDYSSSILDCTIKQSKYSNCTVNLGQTQIFIKQSDWTKHDPGNLTQFQPCYTCTHSLWKHFLLSNYVYYCTVAIVRRLNIVNSCFSVISKAHG